MSTTAAVMGTGSWGTAFAAALADAGTSVTMWGRRADSVAQINARCHEGYLPGILLPAGLRASTDPPAALAGADLGALACPSVAPPRHLQGRNPPPTLCRPPRRWGPVPPRPPASRW